MEVTRETSELDVARQQASEHYVRLAGRQRLDKSSVLTDIIKDFRRDDKHRINGRRRVVEQQIVDILAGEGHTLGKKEQYNLLMEFIEVAEQTSVQQNTATTAQTGATPLSATTVHTGETPSRATVGVASDSSATRTSQTAPTTVKDRRVVEEGYVKDLRKVFTLSHQYGDVLETMVKAAETLDNKAIRKGLWEAIISVPASQGGRTSVGRPNIPKLRNTEHLSEKQYVELLLFVTAGSMPEITNVTVGHVARSCLNAQLFKENGKALEFACLIKELSHMLDIQEKFKANLPVSYLSPLLILRVSKPSDTAALIPHGLTPEWKIIRGRLFSTADPEDLRKIADEIEEGAKKEELIEATATTINAQQPPHPGGGHARPHYTHQESTPRRDHEPLNHREHARQTEHAGVIEKFLKALQEDATPCGYCKWNNGSHSTKNCRKLLRWLKQEVPASRPKDQGRD